MKPVSASATGLIVLAIGGLLALNYPLLSLFDRDATVFGIPLQFVHLFGVWTLLIGGIAILAGRQGDSGAQRRADESAGTPASKRQPSGPST